MKRSTSSDRAEGSAALALAALCIKAGESLGCPEDGLMLCELLMAVRSGLMMTVLLYVR
jgi:hypothetical protein